MRKKYYIRRKYYIDGVTYTIFKDRKTNFYTIFDITPDDGVTTVNIPSEYKGIPITKIGTFVLPKEKVIKHVSIPRSITEISPEAFSQSNTLVSVEIPDTITIIRDKCFAFCQKLRNVQIPNSVTTIGRMAFMCCDSLREIDIPDGVTAIGEKCFALCSKLNNIKISIKHKSDMLYDVFAHCPICNIEFSDGSVYMFY